MIIKKYDVVIVGGGLSGVVSAIKLAESGLNIAIICDQVLNKSASSYAQGGIAAIIDNKDTIKSHVADTYIASGNIANLKSIKQVVNSSKYAIKWLEQHNVKFDRKENGHYSLHLEGGHSIPRILHIKDYTGKAIISKLYENLNKLENIVIYSDYKACKLIKRNNKCIGVYTHNNNNKVIKFIAKKVILASGGASGLYKYVTNPNAGTGSVMIMAYNIGCKLENIEFTQFHPTCFFGKSGEPILISEAIRGSGAVLETEKGIKIMKSIHEKEDLAPRDIVARQIYINIQAGRSVYLNSKHLNSIQWQNKFPYIYNKLLENNINPTINSIPISPASHYSCGGVKVDKNSQTNVQNLYAIGEVSSTGLHGANRLASNSLLECVVYALQASKHILNNLTHKFYQNNEILKIFNSNKNYDHMIAQIQQLMWKKVGLVRKKCELNDAYKNIQMLENSVSQDKTILEKYDYKLEEYKRTIKLAKLTIKNAISRQKSVGSHFII